MIFATEQALIDYGEELGRTLRAPCVLELVGDVGVGKTTLVKGLAKGLQIEEEITSPSYTISKRYVARTGRTALVHYDFYRLDDPGLMSDDLEEAVDDENNVIVVEWADSVKNTLPPDRIVIKFTIRDDGSRLLEVENLQPASEASPSRKVREVQKTQNPDEAAREQSPEERP